MALNWADRLLLASPAREMKALADADHKIYTERIWWRARIRYVAQRRRGTDAHPYLVIADYMSKLRDALASAGAVTDT
jgi:hypothetical protein